ncbi:hypothetical protein SPSYN_02258 [Sporotomaculum syntrophicum]|uniref:WD40 repeat protein n=1 Tax=Sporotomaculum syntrophicum TaxID=182264 RepID=A0A9D2WN51_9FIRM|nr:hypothetical protein [Sporotomaculum syntrophicum]KAF1084480.1 hypothetical protein SPSYN_02258 [Sporotomaculum syntrophicum]
MKKLLLALMITLLLICGCTKNIQSNKSGSPEAETPTANKVYTAKLTTINTLKYFLPAAVLPDGSLFGMTGNNITFWNPQTGAFKTKGSAWSGMLSPDATKLALIDEQGLYMYDLNTGKSTAVAPNSSLHGSSLALGLWSPDSVEFMYMYVGEWSADYFIYNNNTGEKNSYQFQNIPNFLSNPVDWLNNDLLFIVHANKSKTGQQEYRESGYRSDLMLADQTGNFTPLTSLRDGQFVSYGGTTSDNRTILVLVREGDARSSAGLLSVGNPNIEFLPVHEYTVAGSICPDGKFALLITTAEGGRLNAQVFDLISRTVMAKEELAGNEPPLKFMWTKDGRSVSFGQLDGDSNGILYTVQIDEQ